MKITRLSASKVHGYLPLDIDFALDLTFLAGLNGQGKTSALRLLMALLTPRLEELAQITFFEAEIMAQHEGREFWVNARKMPGYLTLTVSDVPDDLTMSNSELELYSNAKRREEARSPVTDQYEQHPVIQHLRKLPTPTFLGLDRRFIAPGFEVEDSDIARRRMYAAKRMWTEDVSMQGMSSAALLEVNFLVVQKMQEIRAAQEKLDEILRNAFFASAFIYKPGSLSGRDKLPSRDEISAYRRQLSEIAGAAEDIKIPVPQIHSALTEFFEKMTSIIESLERKTHVKKIAKPKNPGFEMPDVLLEWFVNKPQADRIIEHLRRLQEYLENRRALRAPVDHFLDLVNQFFSQTNKVVSVSNSGELKVSINGIDDPRSIGALSSGERQIVVMLGHLSLSPHLAGSGIFIVDEPELSLHIGWQEMFVDSVLSANPDVQCIFATHSPAIILDRIESIRDLSESAQC